MRRFSLSLEVTLVNVVDHVYVSFVFLMTLNSWVVDVWWKLKIFKLGPKIN